MNRPETQRGVRELCVAGAVAALAYHVHNALAVLGVRPVSLPFINPLEDYDPWLTFAFQFVGAFIDLLVLASVGSLRFPWKPHPNWFNLTLSGVVDAICGGTLGSVLIIAAGVLTILEHGLHAHSASPRQSEGE
ncbi:MAG: hypothetical protein Kow0069_13760 [Promethearchaeota archaeon]